MNAYIQCHVATEHISKTIVSLQVDLDSLCSMFDDGENSKIPLLVQIVKHQQFLLVTEQNIASISNIKNVKGWSSLLDVIKRHREINDTIVRNHGGANEANLNLSTRQSQLSPDTQRYLSDTQRYLSLLLDVTDSINKLIDSFFLLQ